MRSNAPSPWPAFLLLVGSVAALALLGPNRALLFPALLPWVLAWAALFVLWSRHGTWLDRPGVILGGALVLRILLLPTLPDLSDDLFRYVWDGWLSSRGISPFLYVPSDPALVGFQDSVLFRKMNSPDYHSIYPPLSQLVFLPGGWIHGLWGWPASALAVKGGFLLLETAGVLLLVRTLARSDLPVRGAALYAWNPLVLLVVAGGGHTEGGLVLGLALLLAGLGGGGPGMAWSGWALAVLSKGFPLLLAPLIWRALRRTRSPSQVVRAALLPLGLAGALTLLFLRPDDLVRVAESARLYVQLFEYNAGLYLALTESARALTGEGWGHRVGPALGLLFLVGGTLLALRHPVRDLSSVARGVLLIHSLHLVTATTVHPWYLLWVLPLLPFTSTLREAWLWASFAALPTYLTYLGVSHEALTAFFWGGWVLLALHGSRERILRPLRRLAADRKAGWILPHVQGSSLLDVGGAEGALGEALARGGVRVVVLDPEASPTRSSNRAEAPDSLPRLRGEGEAIPLPSGSVDTVLLSFVLHHARDPDQVLAEAMRVARHRVVILESTFRWRLEGWLLEHLDRWVNSGRSGKGDDRPLVSTRMQIAYRKEEGWRRAAEAAGGTVIGSHRPNRIGHRVLCLVTVPGTPA
ncbi:MAG: class I SAM-dependent methyltransferase [Gemmatimonadales bacterium]|nr:MAG: class I SAM-dependent methyltransferase [Gemmatimonadales bacterium]